MSATLALAPEAKLYRFQEFVEAFTGVIEDAADEAEILARGERLLADLTRHDDWLPNSHAAPDAARYRQYLLYRDPRSRFSVVSFVWGPGQATPIHDHRTWGLIGVLRGAELVESFVRHESGALIMSEPSHILSARGIDLVSPRIGDIHRVSNAYQDRVSISIHVYGGDIGAIERATYTEQGDSKRFVSGYADVAALVA